MNKATASILIDEGTDLSTWSWHQLAERLEQLMGRINEVIAGR